MNIVNGTRKFFSVLAAVIALAMGCWAIARPQPLPWLLSTNHILIAIFFALVAIFFLNWSKT